MPSPLPFFAKYPSLTSFFPTTSHHATMRSKEALERRAAKRGLLVEEQRKRDSPAVAKKHKHAEEDSEVKEIPPSTKEWVCPKCENKNFATRTQCNRCMEERPSTTSSSSTSSSIAAVKVEKKKKQSAPAAAAEGPNWVCAKCANSNFPSRKECHRCQAPKPPSDNGERSGAAPKKRKADQPPSKPSSAKAPKSSTSSSPSPLPPPTAWAKQASPQTVAENQRLREAAAKLLAATAAADTADADAAAATAATTATAGAAVVIDPVQLSEAELTRAQLLLERSRRKKEKKVGKKAAVKAWKEARKKKQKKQKDKKPQSTTA